MARTALGITLAAALVMSGWIVGSAQTTQPDFELIVETQVGAQSETTIRCVKGCVLSWVERGLNRNATAMPEFKFRCTSPETCTSARVGGWIER